MIYYTRKRKKKGNRKTTCSKCGNPKEESRGIQRYCKSCHAAYMREKRPKHSELKPEAKKKANCRSYAKEYLKRGFIKRSHCVVCGSHKSQMHHEDYNKPLEVIWYCRQHHLEHHKNQNKK